MELVTADLEQCEQVIARGLATFVEVGQALARIRDARLYRETHDTFEDYCQERWQMTRKRAYDLIAAEQVTTALSPNGDTPSNEAQARELAPLRDEPERMTEAWQQATATAAAEGRQVTAADVRRVVRQPEISTTKQEPEYTHCPTCGHRVRADKPLRPRGDSR